MKKRVYSDSFKVHMTSLSYQRVNLKDQTNERCIEVQHLYK